VEASRTEQGFGRQETRLRGDLSADVFVGREPETEMEQSGIEVNGLQRKKGQAKNLEG